MADNSEQYSKSIQDFAKSLQGLMAAIVDSIETAKDNNPIEAIKKLAEDIAASTDVIETIQEDVKSTKNNSDEILAIVKSLQREKRKGMFDRLTDKGKGKASNVADGIKTIKIIKTHIIIPIYTPYSIIISGPDIIYYLQYTH